MAKQPEITKYKPPKESESTVHVKEIPNPLPLVHVGSSLPWYQSWWNALQQAWLVFVHHIRTYFGIQKVPNSTPTSRPKKMLGRETKRLQRKHAATHARAPSQAIRPKKRKRIPQQRR
jgi:hypothetical protein